MKKINGRVVPVLNPWVGNIIHIEKIVLNGRLVNSSDKIRIYWTPSAVSIPFAGLNDTIEN